MMVVLPITAWILIFYLSLKESFYFKNLSIRERFLSSLIIWVALLALITEVLSIFSFFTFSGLILCWLLLILVFVLLILKVRRKKVVDYVFLLKSFRDINVFSKLLLFGVLAIIVLTGLLALLAAPNNVDSMAYHLPRVEQWIQNQSIEHYLTNNQKQNYLNPGAEFIIAHFQLLSGGDRFANMIQWGALISTLIGISLITKLFGGDLQRQLFSAVFVATIPMVILQASTTQNDLIASAWLISFIYFGIVSFKKQRKFFYVLSGIALGVALLTKATIYLYALPFFVWFSYEFFKVNKRQLIVFFFITSLIALIVNAGYFMRNITYYGSPVEDSAEYINGNFSFSGFFSNTLKNVFMHAWTPFYQVNETIYSLNVDFQKNLKIDVNDSALNWENTKFSIPRLTADENIAINPFHLYLILLVIFIAISKVNDKHINKYIGCLILGFLLFALILRWQPYGSRLQLPLFILWSVPFAIYIAYINEKVEKAILIFLLSVSFYWIFFNNMKPILLSKISILNTPRELHYFYGVDLESYLHYSQAVEIINQHGYKNIGLIVDDNFLLEYPFYVMLKKMNYKYRVEYIGVDSKNMSIKNNFNPEVVVYIGNDSKVIDKYSKQNSPFIVLY